jgi:hypothetical protein
MNLIFLTFWALYFIFVGEILFSDVGDRLKFFFRSKKVVLDGFSIASLFISVGLGRFFWIFLCSRNSRYPPSFRYELFNGRHLELCFPSVPGIAGNP